MNTLSFDDDLIDRCCLYLLGELPADEAMRLEGEAMTSDTVRACLLQQAELIAALGTTAATSPSLAAPQPQLNAQSRPAQPQPSALDAAPVRRTATIGWSTALAVALAASVLVVIVRDRSVPLHDDAPSDSVQLAHAWAASRSVAEPSTDDESVANWDGERWLPDAPQQPSNRSAPTDTPALDGASESAADARHDMPVPADGYSSFADAATTPAGPPEWLIVAVCASELQQDAAHDGPEVADE